MMKRVLYILVISIVLLCFIDSTALNYLIEDKIPSFASQTVALHKKQLSLIAYDMCRPLKSAYVHIPTIYNEAMKVWHDEHDPRHMPAYYQGDPAWSGTPYAHGGTIGSNGCGLTAAAMSFEYWTRQQCTPQQLRDAVGDSCTYGGLNYMPAFADYARNNLGLQASNQIWDLNWAISEAWAGHTVWCSVSGRFGANSYGGHLVLLWKNDNDQLCINDPASPENTRVWLEQELRSQPSWVYFVSVWKQF